MWKHDPYRSFILIGADYKIPYLDDSIIHMQYGL